MKIYKQIGEERHAAEGDLFVSTWTSDQPSLGSYVIIKPVEDENINRTLLARIHVELCKDGSINVQTSTSDKIIIVGLLEAAKYLIQTTKQESPIVIPDPIVPTNLKG